ncbi:MAG: hypothetical protein O7D86_07060 [Proteobacteria bacterium]|nr:hypothetical protein [Pseudomonadota bacterium]
MRLFTITLILMLIPTTILAVDNSGNFAIWGVGKKSCYGYGQSTAGDDFEKYKHYMKGFLTAYNVFTENTYNISGKMNENQIVEWINDYCEENPMSSFENALTSFTFDHYEKRMKTSKSGTGR